MTGPTATCASCQHPMFWHDERGCRFTGPGRYACQCAAKGPTKAQVNAIIGGTSSAARASLRLTGQRDPNLCWRSE